MAEVLGIVSSIIAIGDLTSKLVSYAKGVKGAPVECQQFIRELEEMQRILSRLRNKVDTEMPNLSDSTKMLQPTIEEFGKLITSLVENLGLDATYTTGGFGQHSDSSAKKTFWQNALWPFQKEEVDFAVTAVQRYISYINQALVQDVGERVSELQRDHAESSARLEAALTAPTHVRVLPPGEQGLKIWQDEKTRSAVHWLSPLKFYEKHADMFGRRTDDTGNWLLESLEFKDWVAGNRKYLLCTGLPGAGKSILASIVIDFLQRTIQNQNVAVCYFYCHYKDQETQTTVNLLGSFLRQLATKHERITPVVMKLYEKCRSEDQACRPSAHDYTQILTKLVPTFDKVYVVLDALDECSANERDQFILEMKKLPLQFLVTSRHIVDILELFRGVAPLEIRAHDKDIKKYLERQMEVRPALARVARDKALVEEIVLHITRSADGMFLLAKLHLDSVATKATPDDIRTALNDLPKGFDETYDKAMRHCAAQSPEQYSFTKRILMWLVYSARPLSPREMQLALFAHTGVFERLSSDMLPSLDYILSVCGGLITYEQTSKQLQLIHYTTQEYLKRHQTMLSVDAHSDIAICCMNFLRSIDKCEAMPTTVGEARSTSYRKYLKSRHPFLAYSAEYWVYHARTGSTPELLQQTNLFLRERDTIYSTLCSEPWDSSSPAFFSWGVQDCVPLLVAAGLGLGRTVQSELESGVNSRVKNSLGENALGIAAGSGHADVVYILLTAMGYKCDPPAGLMCDVTGNAISMASIRRIGRFSVPDRLQTLNRKDKESGSTPLLRACERERWEVVKVLLSAGADCRSTDCWNHSPLEYTSDVGNVEVVWLLLEKGADLQTKNRYNETALMKAASRGHTEIVRLLLEKGADVEMKDENGENALMRASFNGHTEIVRLLLEKGADFQAKNTYNETALIKAASRGHTEIVRLLLEKGADVRIKGRDSENALMKAAFNGYAEIVRLLLEKGADVQAKNKDNTTALMKAASRGHTEIVRLLLEKGADVEIKGRDSENALMKAAFNGYTEIVRLLLEKGAVVQAKNKDNVAALMRAASGGCITIVRLLLEKGADVEMKDRNSENALMEAASNGYAEIVRLLLEKGADVQAKNKDDTTALMKAASTGHTEIVRLLLEKDADVEMKDRNSENALMEAAFNGYTEIVRLLLEKGAGVQAKNRGDETALTKAAYRGHLDIVRLLLEKNAIVNVKVDDKVLLERIASYGHIEVLRLLLESRGTEVDVKDRYAEVAFMKTVSKGNLKLVQWLLEKGMDVQVRDARGWNAVICAASNNHTEIVQLLLEKGADMEAKDNSGRNTLMNAVCYGNLEIVQLLIEKGADMEAKDNSGRNTLMRAVYYGNLEIVQLLAEKGADMEAKDKSGRNALMNYGNLEIVQLLIEKGADMEAKDNNGGNALMNAAHNIDELEDRLWGLYMIAHDHRHDKNAHIKAACNADFELPKDTNYEAQINALQEVRSKGHTEIVRLLLEKGSDVEAKDNDGENALMKAVHKDKLEIVQLLVDKGSDVEAKDNNGENALMKAVYNGNLEILQLLMEKGADVDAKDNNGENALMKAADCGKLGIVHLLIAKGSDMEAKDSSGTNALMKAVYNLKLEIVHLLIDKGANCKSLNNNGENPIHVICRAYDPYRDQADEHRAAFESILQLLLDNGADPNLPDNDSKTPAWIAEMGGFLWLYQVILSKRRRTHKFLSPFRLG